MIGLYFTLPSPSSEFLDPFSVYWVSGCMVYLREKKTAPIVGDITRADDIAVVKVHSVKKERTHVTVTSHTRTGVVIL